MQSCIISHSQYSHDARTIERVMCTDVDQSVALYFCLYSSILLTSSSVPILFI